MSHSEHLNSNGFEDTVETSRDRNRTLVGRAERGGRVATGALAFAATCKVEEKRDLIEEVEVEARLEREPHFVSISLALGLGVFPMDHRDMIQIE